MNHFTVCLTIVLCLCQVWTSISGVHHGHNGGGYRTVHHNSHPKYDFSYNTDGDHYGPKFGHSESRDGYNTKGEYYVHLPDGRLQQVSYYVDEWGYHPTVTYQGKAQFPSHYKSYSSKGHRGYNRGYY